MTGFRASLLVFGVIFAPLLMALALAGLYEICRLIISS